MAIHVGKHIITLNASPCDYHPRPISVIHAHACQQNVSQDELDGNQVAASSQPSADGLGLWGIGGGSLIPGLSCTAFFS